MLLLLAGCGGERAPSSVVPADSVFYVGMEAERAERLLQSTSREDVDFDRDVRPWIGARAAYFTDGSADTYGLVFASEDDAAAEAFARKVTAAGPLRASAVIDGHLVVTSSRELLRAADAAEGGQALADSARLDVAGETGKDAPEVLIATVEPETFVAALEVYADLPDHLPEVDFGDGPLTARIFADVIELHGLPPRPAAPTLADVSSDAQLAVASGDLSEGDELAFAAFELERRSRYRDLEALGPYLGAGTLALEGRFRSDLRARLVAEIDDEAGLRATIAALPRRPGFEIADGRVTIDIGGGASGSGRLGETARYREAERRLGGPPTLMTDDVVLRLDERGVLRIVR